MNIRASLLTAIVLCLAPVHSQAAVVSTLHGTGVDDGGMLLAAGAIDPHYSLILSPDASHDGPETFVASNMPFQWLANGPSSQWISPNANGNFEFTNGIYIYRTLFDLTGFNPNTAVIHGQWTTDNDGLDIVINGTSTGFTTPETAFQQRFFDFTISSGFIPGLNILDFHVRNSTFSPSPPASA